MGVENHIFTIVLDPSVFIIVSLVQDSPGFSDHRMTNRSGRGLLGESTREELRSVWSDRSWSQRREELRSRMFNCKLQEVPSLARIEDDVSLEATGEAYKVSNLSSLPHWQFGQGFSASDAKKWSGMKCKSRRGRHDSGFDYLRRQREGNFKRPTVRSRNFTEKVAIRKQTLKANGWSSSKAPLVPSTVSDGEDGERGVESEKQEGINGLDTDGDFKKDINHSHWCTTDVENNFVCGVSDVQNGSVRGEMVLESSLCPATISSPPGITPVKSSAQRAINLLDRAPDQEKQERRRMEMKWYEEMLEDVLLKMLDERGKVETEQAELEILKSAAHLIKGCHGCNDTRHESL